MTLLQRSNIFQVLLAEPRESRRADLSARVTSGRQCRIMENAKDLSQLYHLAEHHPPHLAVISSTFAFSEGFDTLAALFRGLNIPFVLASWHGAPKEPLAKIARRLKAPVLDARLPPAALEKVLIGVIGDAKTRKTDRSRDINFEQSNNQITDFCAERRILIGSSTGGIDALIKILSHFPENCPPTVIVQHTGPEFSEGLVRLIDRHTQAKVVLPCGPTKLLPGQVLVAPGGNRHLVFRGKSGNECTLIKGAPVCGHSPSVNVLFQSAQPIAHRISAAILTGMGSDGAEGLAALFKGGATTVGQDEATSVVYGMPRKAIEAGGVEFELPLCEIGPKLLQSCRRTIGKRRIEK